MKVAKRVKVKSKHLKKKKKKIDGRLGGQEPGMGTRRLVVTALQFMPTVNHRFVHLKRTQFGKSIIPRYKKIFLENLSLAFMEITKRRSLV